MIKVNLLYDISAVKRKPKASVDVSMPSMDMFSGASENAQIGIRVAAFAIPLILLYSFRWYSYNTSEVNYHKLQQEQQGIQNKLKELDPVVKEVEKFEEEKRKLNAQLQTIKSLSKERLKNVKSLDMLQTIIPYKAWITQLKLIDKNVDIEGMASDDIVISEFMQNLEASIYFANVRLISSEESKRAEGVMKKFKIKCFLENL